MNILVGKSTLKFNQAVVYVLEVMSLKKPLESSSSCDQALATICVAGKNMLHEQEGQEKGHTCMLST